MKLSDALPNNAVNWTASAANGSPVAAEALQRIAALYAIEQQAKNMNADERLRMRQEHA